jgi:hypothetical protein
MPTAIVTIICIAMIVVGGMTLSQGLLTTAEAASISVDTISVREGDMMRTSLETVRAAELAWGDYLRITVRNTGQTKLANFEKWDVILNYVDSANITQSVWLPNTAFLPGDNQWQKARIGLNGPVEFFEPGILNPSEEVVILARLNPLPGAATSGVVSIAAPNGVEDSMSFTNPGCARFTPQSENVTINSSRYYELVEAAAADGAVTTMRADFSDNESGRKLLCNTDQPDRPATYVYPLIGIKSIPAATWTFYYRCYISGNGEFPCEDNDICFNVDILVRQADGSVRAVIATGAASAWIEKGEEGYWLTISATYAFPGYTVADGNDYLEISYYGQTDSGPDGGSGCMQLSIDDSSLDITDQTRIES